MGNYRVSDYFKLAALVLLYSVCFYSGGTKWYSIWYPADTGNSQAPTLSIDYQICEKISENCAGKGLNIGALKGQCETSVKQAFSTADQSKCTGFKSAFLNCYNENRNTQQCGVEASNYENCVNTYVTSHVNQSFC